MNLPAKPALPPPSQLGAMMDSQILTHIRRGRDAISATSTWRTELKVAVLSRC